MKLNPGMRRARRLPLPSVNLDYIDDNHAVRAFNRQRRANDADRARDLAYDQRIADLQREKRQRDILAKAVTSALGGVVAGTSPSIAPASGTVAGGSATPSPAPSPQPPSQPSPPPPSQPLNARAFNLDVARRFAGAGLGNQASSALGTVFALDGKAASLQDGRYRQVLDLAGSGEVPRAEALARRYGLNIPKAILRDGITARAFSLAGDLYRGDKQAAARFIEAYRASGGNLDAGRKAAGPPRGSRPSYTTRIGNDGLAYRLNEESARITPYTGAPDGDSDYGIHHWEFWHPEPHLEVYSLEHAAKRTHDTAVAFTNSLVGRLDQLPNEVDRQTWRRVYKKYYQELVLTRRFADVRPSGADIRELVTGYGTPNAAHMRTLAEDPSPARIRQFDGKFGEGAAERVLERTRPELFEEE